MYAAGPCARSPSPAACFKVLAGKKSSLASWSLSRGAYRSKLNTLPAGGPLGTPQSPLLQLLLLLLLGNPEKLRGVGGIHTSDAWYECHAAEASIKRKHHGVFFDFDDGWNRNHAKKLFNWFKFDITNYVGLFGNRVVVSGTHFLSDQCVNSNAINAFKTHTVAKLRLEREL